MTIGPRSLAGESYAETHSVLDALKEFNQLQAELNHLFEKPVITCQINEKDLNGARSDFDRCSLMNYCKKFIGQTDSPNLYQGTDGTIVNDQFFREQNTWAQCLKITYKDDVAQKVEEFSRAQKAKHLKEVLILNQKLQANLKKNNEFSKMGMINIELINSNLSNELNADETSDEPVDLKQRINLAETKLKIKLSPSTIDLLVAIEQKTNDKKYIEESKSFEASLFPSLKPTNLFSNMANFTDVAVAGNTKKLIQNQKIYNQKSSEVYNYFFEAKKDLVEYLMSKRTLFNKNEIDRAVTRVKLIKFKTPSLGEDFVKACENPNAWYSSNNNTMTICPGWLDRPKMFLYETFAHELSHSIDPCNLSAPMKIKSSKADEVEEAPFEVTLKMEELNQSQVLFGETSNDSLKSSDQKIMNVKDHPFYKMLSCLQDPKSIGAIVPNVQQIQQQIDSELDFFNKSGRSNSTDTYYSYLKFAKDNLGQFNDQYGLCHFQSSAGVSQIEEAFADKMASELIAKKLAAMPKEVATREMEKIILGDLNTDDALCPKGPNIEKMKAHGVEVGCDVYFANKAKAEKMAIALEMSSHFNKDSHPLLINRFDRLIFAHPTLRKILNCSPNGVKYCEN